MKYMWWWGCSSFPLDIHISHTTTTDDAQPYTQPQYNNNNNQWKSNSTATTRSTTLNAYVHEIYTIPCFHVVCTCVHVFSVNHHTTAHVCVGCTNKNNANVQMQHKQLRLVRDTWSNWSEYTNEYNCLPANDCSMRCKHAPTRASEQPPWHGTWRSDKYRFGAAHLTLGRQII